MKKYKSGRKWFDLEKGLPRLYLNEKHEKYVRNALRAVTFIGIAVSVVTLNWYIALPFSIFLAFLDWFLERTLFYYSSMYVESMLFDYDPEEWHATVFVFIGEPEDRESMKVVGVWLKSTEYAEKYFETLRNWTGLSDNTQGDLRLSFIVDEDTYYVYFYKKMDNEPFNSHAASVEERNQLDKFGKEHFPMVMKQVICKGFETTKDFALGRFLDNVPVGAPFVLAAFKTSEDGTPVPADAIEPIYMRNYKFKIPQELDQNDFEYHHWHGVVERSGIGNA